MKKHVGKMLQLDNMKGKILYYGTDTDFFKRKGNIQKSDNITFLQISSFTEKKGHEFTIQSFYKYLKSIV